jgi:hypothetical protein
MVIFVYPPGTSCWVPNVRALPLSVKQPMSVQPAGMPPSVGGEGFEDLYKVRRFEPPQNSDEFPEHGMSHPLLAIDPGVRMVLPQ